MDESSLPLPLVEPAGLLWYDDTGLLREDVGAAKPALEVAVEPAGRPLENGNAIFDGIWTEHFQRGALLLRMGAVDAPRCRMGHSSRHRFAGPSPFSQSIRCFESGLADPCDSAVNLVAANEARRLSSLLRLPNLLAYPRRPPSAQLCSS